MEQLPPPVPSNLDFINTILAASVSVNNVQFSISGLTGSAGAGTVQINARFKPGVTGPGDRARKIDEGLDWARTAGDQLQEALLHLVRAWSQITANNTEGIAADFRRRIVASRQGGHIPM